MVNLVDKVFVIAEAGVNHNGDESLALQLVDAAAHAGADAVKFQSFSAEKLVALGANKAEYQIRETGSGDQYSMLKALELSESAHRNIFERCSKLGIEFMSTPFDEGAVDFLLTLGMRRIKVPSGEITNEPFLEFLAKKDCPLILSTGMANLEEIKRAVEVISQARHASGLEDNLSDILTILHCTSNYPAAYCDVNLRAMKTIGRETGLPIGYSDHTLGISVSIAAVAMGARVIEKHFTINCSLTGPDHKASLEPNDLKALINQIRDIQDALGSPKKVPTPSELPIRDLVRRSITLTRDIKRGEILCSNDMVLLRPGTGIPPANLNRLVGSTITRDLLKGATLQWADVK